MQLDQSAKLRTSPALIIVSLPTGESDTASVGIYNFLAKSFSKCPVETLYWLSYFSEARTLNEACQRHPNYPKEAMLAEIEALLEQQILTADGTPPHARCQNYRDNWKWDLTAGIFHFTVLDNDFMSLAESEAEQLDKLEHSPLPDSYWLAKSTSTIALPTPSSPSTDNLIDLICSRRTNRTSAGGMVSLQQLGDCLFAAFGITGFVKTTSGYAPVSTAPSGGARNPFEAYIIVNRCQGLGSGVYHYCSISHELEFVSGLEDNTPVSSMFGSQQWIDEMAVVVVMVAVFDRSMWKYQDGNAYRVLLIEAGHRAQNFMLCATRQGLTSCPTAAIAHSKVSNLFGLSEPLLQAPVYALTLDKALAYPDQLLSVESFRQSSALLPTQAA